MSYQISQSPTLERVTVQDLLRANTLSIGMSWDLSHYFAIRNCMPFQWYLLSRLYLGTFCFASRQKWHLIMPSFTPSRRVRYWSSWRLGCMLPCMTARVVIEQWLKDQKYRARIVTSWDIFTSPLLPNSNLFSIGDRWPGWASIGHTTRCIVACIEHPSLANHICCALRFTNHAVRRHARYLPRFWGSI